MLCDKCKTREAKVYYTETVGGKKIEQHLCEECASTCTSFQIGTKFLDGGMALDSILSSILGISGGNGTSESTHTVGEIRCKGCGMSYRKFLENGKFGCAGCYSAFGRFLPRSFKGIQGADRHSGKIPEGYYGLETSEAEAVKTVGRDIPVSVSDHAGEPEGAEILKKRLKEAVEREEFEEAARLRDEIRSLTKASCDGGSGMEGE